MTTVTRRGDSRAAWRHAQLQAQFTFSTMRPSQYGTSFSTVRARTRDKRRGDLVRVELATETPSLVDVTAERAIEIDDALRVLDKEASRAVKIVEFQFFAGLPIDQVGEQLGISTPTVNREWRFARAFLHGASD